MMFDEQPDGDIHGECAAEIHKLEAENAALRAELEKRTRSAYSQQLLGEIVKLQDKLAALRAELKQTIDTLSINVEMRKQAEAELAALKAGDVVMVPREPTPEMIKFAEGCVPKTPAAQYRAMIAAAPGAQAGEERP